ncbi:MAG: hypothetical protein K9N55_00635 [Phycisphaerae bacterium]|nr:hypothetical protein [Phycisphaerae bacterium]
MTKINIKICLCVLVCVILLWSLAGAQGTKTYEIRPQIPESVFKNESARAMDAYERVIDRVLELNGRQLDSIDLRVKDLSTQLSRVEAKLDRLLNHTRFIEYALGIPQGELTDAPQTTQPEDPNTPEKEQDS